MNTQKVLITGSEGAIGRQVVARLHADGHEVATLDRVPSHRPADEGGVHYECDLRDVDQVGTVFAEARPDIVVNMAACLFGTAEANLRLAMEINCVAADDIARLSVQHEVDLLVHFSTKSVYSPGNTGVVTEDSLVGPATNYGITKLASEYAVKRSLERGPTTGALLRMGSTYGPGKGPEHGAVAWLSTLVSRAVAGETTKVSVAPESASDYIYNIDVAAGVSAICQNYDSWRSGTETFNITSGREISARRLCEELNKLADRETVVFVESPEVADIVVPHGMVLDGAKARDVVGFVPHYGPREGLAHYYQQQLAAK